MKIWCEVCKGQGHQLFKDENSWDGCVVECKECGGKGHVDDTELERLAEIGRATEKEFDEFDLITAIKFHEKEYEEQEEQFVDTQKSRDFDALEDLLEWAEGSGD